jgi:hypothetical protein
VGTSTTGAVVMILILVCIMDGVNPSAVRRMTNPLPNVILSPDPRLPLLVVGLGAALLPLPGQPWPTLVVVLFGLFLLIQTASLRLEFEERALIVWQNGRELRRFPYEHWLAWRLFAPWLPGLFFFRETKSIHFLPILFSPSELRAQLEQRVGALETTQKQSENKP